MPDLCPVCECDPCDCETLYTFPDEAPEGSLTIVFLFTGRRHIAFVAGYRWLWGYGKSRHGALSSLAARLGRVELADGPRALELFGAKAATADQDAEEAQDEALC